MDNQDGKDYEVGYKRPPKAHQFKEGKSGHPSGRPKLAKAFKTDLQEELEEIIVINEGGKQKSTTKQRAMIKRLTASALGGNIQAIKTLMGIIASMIPKTEDPVDELSPEDLELLQKHYGGSINDNV